jgi:hypothetical protein
LKKINGSPMILRLAAFDNVDRAKNLAAGIRFRLVLLPLLSIVSGLSPE